MLCKKCGQDIPENVSICQYCGALVEGAVPACEPQKPENIPLGILGALIGALLGGLSIVLLGQAGYVASISGIILAFCTLKGYELLGGKLSKLGIGLSVVLIVVMPFCAYLVGTGISIMNELKEIAFDLTLFESIQLMFEMLEVDPSLKDTLVSDLLMLYLFTGLGVAGYLIDKFKKAKK